MKKLLCLIGAAAMLLVLCACNGDGNEPTTAEPTTVFEKYVIAKEVAQKLPEGTVLRELDGKTYSLIEYEGKQCLAVSTTLGNLQVVHEFEGDFELLDNLNERGGSSLIFFAENNDSDTKRCLKSVYLPTATVTTVIPAPCSSISLFNVPESYELYGYAFAATGSGIKSINLSTGAESGFSKSLDDIRVFFETPESLFAQGKRNAYTYTSVEAIDKVHLQASVYSVNSKGEQELTAQFTYNPLNGVFMNTFGK